MLNALKIKLSDQLLCVCNRVSRPSSSMSEKVADKPAVAVMSSTPTPASMLPLTGASEQLAIKTVPTPDMNVAYNPAQPAQPTVNTSTAAGDRSSGTSANIVGVHFRVGKKIGEGSFGILYEGSLPLLLSKITKR